MVVGGPVFGTGPKEVQCVVHPAHIPFIIKTKTALTGRFRDPGIIGRIFGNEDAAGIPAFDPGIHSFHKVYGIAVDTTAFIALPVQDPADGIHAQTVEMVSLHPVVGAGLEKAADLSPGMHEIITAPLADTNIRVRIFKKGSAVVLHQCVVINGKMNGDKIQKNTNPCLVEKIHHILEIGRRSISAGRCIEAGGLISPAFVAGMFSDWQNFYIVVSGFLQIGNQECRKFIIPVPFRAGIVFSCFTDFLFP